MNSYSTSELKFFQKQVRGLNTKQQNMLKSKRINDNIGSVLDELIEVQNMTAKGYAKFSLKHLKSMNESEITSYIENISKANNLLNLINSSKDFENAFAGFNNANIDIESAFWNMFKLLQLAGVNLDSEQIKDITEDEDLSNSQLEALFDAMKDVYADSSEYGEAHFARVYENIVGLK